LQKTIEAIPCRLDLVVRAYFRIVMNFILLSELLPEAPQTLLAFTKRNLHFLASSVKSRLQEEEGVFGRKFSRKADRIYLKDLNTPLDLIRPWTPYGILLPLHAGRMATGPIFREYR
jgi:hypothetical protein